MFPRHKASGGIIRPRISAEIFAPVYDIFFAEQKTAYLYFFTI
jgi:hypothetical protein